jgi:RNA polymerase sigma-70 factor (ECF subfamily)
MTTLSDAELLISVKEGDGSALEKLYDRYAALVHSLALQITREPALAQEIVQDVFTKIWVSPNLYDPERGRFSSWLLTVTRNIAIDALRKRERKDRLSILPPLMIYETMHESPDFSEGMEQRELAAVVQKGMQILKPEQQTILQLTYWEGFSLSEVARKLGLPPGTVKSRLHSALKHLRDYLETWKEGRL